MKPKFRMGLYCIFSGLYALGISIIGGFIVIFILTYLHLTGIEYSLFEKFAFVIIPYLGLAAHNYHKAMHFYKTLEGEK